MVNKSSTFNVVLCLLARLRIRVEALAKGIEILRYGNRMVASCEQISLGQILALSQHSKNPVLLVQIPDNVCGVETVQF